MIQNCITAISVCTHIKLLLKGPREFGGLWQYQNNPACTKSVRIFRVFKLGTTRQKKKSERVAKFANDVDIYHYTMNLT